jgi:hypothetical protein
MSIISKIKDSEGFNSVKKTLERNVVINLIDIVNIKDKTDEEIEDYVGEALSKEKVLQNAVNEILRDQEALRTLIKVNIDYGENDTTDDLIGPLQQELRAVSEKRGRAGDAEEDGPGDDDEATRGRSDGEGDSGDGEGQDQSSEGGHTDSEEESGDDRREARKRTATE